ncbi:MAG TPA: hydrogen gas-evolving membrane-bound hydrogenase subunit E [Acidimicrobiales bacterium]|nr:hydrogen gas-evolving membrane-bound hydrogenase subunit E [Acidimicrobiales bacterium]
MLLGLLAFHAIAGIGVVSAGRSLGRWGLLVGGTAPALTIGWAAANAAGVLDGEAITGRAEWVPELGLGLDVRLDSFALLMVVLVAGIGTLVFVYGWHYFGSSDKTGRAAGLLTLFAGSMLGVVLADNLLLLYVCWELTSITSYLLIGIDDAEPEARSAALHALLVTGLGGLAMLGGFVLIGQQAGTYRITEIVAAPPTGTTVAVAVVLVLIGAFTKSAQYPFHSWLPAAMVAPTPISAYLHSAAMVKAGVYLVARLAPAFAGVGVWRPLVVTVGLVTMLAGGLRALRPFDLKQLLAFGTTSQLGFMMVLVGIGQPEATAAGCALILAHGVFKAALFMVVGVVDHEAGTRDIRDLPLLGKGWTVTRAVALVSAASMAAVPPLAGFIAKEEAYGALVHGSLADRVVLAGIVIGSVLTVAYSLRFAAALVRPDLVGHGGTERPGLSHGPAAGFVAPAVVLAVGSVVLGVVPGVWSELIDQAARALDARSGAHLALWHGLNEPLALSLATLGAGALLFRGRRRVAPVQARLAPAITGAQVYDGAVRSVLLLAARTTSIVQSGSLPIYAAVILATAAVVPGTAMLSGSWWPGWPDLVGRPVHVPIAALLIVAGIAATLATRRFAAALLLGVVGYGMAILFVVQGAPDLALTQFAVETLSVVVFLLVLRRLPDRFERRKPAVGRLVRLAVSGAVGVFVVMMAVAASGARTEPPVSREMSELALPEGDGKNVVNVILVDIRGLDTLGEITVLVAAGIGIVALARSGERPRPRPPARAVRRSRRAGRS